MSSSSIADSGTVWLDTYIKIIVNCREINHTLRKLKQLTEKNMFIFLNFYHLSTSKRSFHLNIPFILLVFIDLESTFNINEKHEMKNPHFWKYKPSNVVLRSILQPRKSTIVAISHYLKLPNCNVLWNKHILYKHFTCFIDFYIFNVFGTTNIYIVCLWKWLRDQFLI